MHVATGSSLGGPRKTGRQLLYELVQMANWRCAVSKEGEGKSSAKNGSSTTSWNENCWKHFLPAILRRLCARVLQIDPSEARVQVGIVQVEPG
jgi:hypothetical protein